MNERARRIKRSRFAIIFGSLGTALAGIPATIAGMPLLIFAGSIIGGIIGSILDRRYPPYEPPETTETPVETQ
jgi:hypothetical protein